MLHELLASPLAVEPQYFQTILLPQLEREQSGAAKAEPFQQARVEVVTGRDTQGRTQKVAVVAVSGLLTKQGYYGTGYYTLQQQLREAYADTSVAGVVLYTNSPGGAVAGLEAPAALIAGAPKPVVAYSDGMIASAAYRLASQAREVVLADNATSVGSIGTLVQHMDVSKALADRGIKVSFITATRSTDKVKGNPYEPLDDATVAQIREGLDELNTDFIQSVEASRGKRLQTKQEDVFTGKMYSARKAVQYGLADSQGGLDVAVSRVLELARLDREQPPKQVSSSTPDTMSKTNLVLTAALQAGGFLPADQELQANAETLQAADKVLQTMQGELATAKQEALDAKQAQQTAEQGLATAQQEATTAKEAEQTAKQSLQTQNTELLQLRAWKAEADKNQNPARDLSQQEHQRNTPISSAEQSVNEHFAKASSYKMPDLG
jgi:ClpP class serine protease